jgi:hypothetical protein
MDVSQILEQLRSERNRLDGAIQALEGLNTGRVRRGPGRPAGVARAAQQQSSATTGKRRGPRHMSAAARKRISEMMKKRWAERRRNAA